MYKLEIWDKAQRESAQHPKSNWGDNLGGSYSSYSKVTWPELQRIAYAERAVST